MFRLARPFMRRVRTSLCFRCRRVRHLLVEDAVARLFVDLMEADLLARGCRWKQRNGTRDERQLEVAFPVSTTATTLLLRNYASNLATDFAESTRDLPKKAVLVMFSLPNAHPRGHAQFCHRIRAERRTQTCAQSSPRTDGRTLPSCE